MNWGKCLYQKEQGHIHICVCASTCRSHNIKEGRLGQDSIKRGESSHSPKASHASNNMFIVSTHDNSFVHTSELYVLSQFPYINESGIRYVFLFNLGNL